MNAQYIAVKRKNIDSIREHILERDHYTCRYCGSRTSPFHIDHVYPVSKGGETTEDNLVTSCQRCNSEKHNKVGTWPKPIGWFEKKPYQVPMAGLLFIVFSLASLYNSISTILDFPSFIFLGRVLGFVGILFGLVGIGLLMKGK